MAIHRIRPNQAIAIRAHGERNRPVSRAAKFREEIGQPSDHVDERTKAKPAFIGLAMIRQKVVIMRLWPTVWVNRISGICAASPLTIWVNFA